MGMPNIKTGTATGTGSAINVSIGFIPDYVRIVNATDLDQIDATAGGRSSTIRAGTGVAYEKQRALMQGSAASSALGV